MLLKRSTFGFLVFALLTIQSWAGEGAANSNDDDKSKSDQVCENDQVNESPQSLDDNNHASHTTVKIYDTVEDGFVRDASYFKSIVDPALSVHPRANRVLVISDQCQIVQEIISNYPKVKNITMFNIPEHPDDNEANDDYSLGCEAIEADLTIDDEKVKFYNFFDSVEWFIDRYGPTFRSDPTRNFPQFKVAILDPSMDMDLLMERPRIQEFIDALYRSMHEDSMLVIRAGLWTEAFPRQHTDMLDETEHWTFLTDTLDELGADLVTDYQVPTATSTSERDDNEESSATTRISHYGFWLVMKKDAPFERKWLKYWDPNKKQTNAEA